MKLLLPVLVSMFCLAGCGPTRQWESCTNSACEKCMGAGSEPCQKCDQKGSHRCEDDTLANDLLDTGCSRGDVECSSCNGKGKSSGYKHSTCSSCGGAGQYAGSSCISCGGGGGSYGRGKRPCPKCNGTSRSRCSPCNGTGRVRCGRWVIIEEK